MDSPLPSLPMRPWTRILMGLLGAVSFVAGVIAVFITQNELGAAVLVVLGGVLLVLALWGSSIESLEFGGAKLVVRTVQEKLRLADASEGRGDIAEAGRLRAEARALLETIEPVASEYRLTRASMSSGPARTQAMEKVVSDVRRLSAELPLDSAEVSRWLRQGSEEQRIAALAIMQARPELRDFDAALEAIEHSRSAFEQYHAMLLSLQMLDDLDQEHRCRLAEVIKSEREVHFRDDGDRLWLSERILAEVDPQRSR
ncbi:hypothetical protein [Microbispora sp. H13382]|uniref:hypothetical protein n=1 Tax=Microbispora sp. H13382 TaxID=2729112 RepID=UPI001C7189E2|nr:hypothetical protein [Microbispora sp. H13382]